MDHAIALYRPSRRYALFSGVALAAAVPSAWVSTQWGAAWLVAAVLLAVTAALTLLIALRPSIEIHTTHVRIGRRVVFWNEIRALDRISFMDREPWAAPLLLRVTLPRKQEILIFHPGDADSCISLLRHIYRYARTAALDGLTYREFWGEQLPVSAAIAHPQPRFLSVEDEEEVERLFQRLKVAGRLDNSDES